MTHINLDLTDDLADSLRQRAEVRGLTVSEYLTSLIRRDIHRAWPEDYFETVFGRWEGEPCERPPQDRFEKREAL